MLKTIVTAAVLGAALFSGAGVASAAPVIQCQAIGCQPQGEQESPHNGEPGHNPNEVAPDVDDRPNGPGTGNCGRGCQWK